MKSRLLVLCVAVFAPMLCAKPPADVQARLDAFLKDKPGGIAVAWVDGDGVAFFQAGKFAANKAQAITPDTQFEIGSVTKVFTALLFAEMERAGEVRRDDPVGKYLLAADDPAQPALAKITLLSLATHTSGLPHDPRPVGIVGNAVLQYTRPELINLLKAEGRNESVGAAVSYSNFGVSLLGEALATAAAKPYAELLRERVLGPLGLEHTLVATLGTKPAAELAPGHTAEGKPVGNYEFAASAPAGALRSSTRDMATFLQAALGGEKAPLHAAFMETSKPLRQMGSSDRIGLIWNIINSDQGPIVWHNGATAGYHSFVGFMRAGGGAGVAVLSNRAERTVDDIGQALLGAELARRTPAYRAPGFAGRYPLSPTFAIDIAETDGALTAQATGQGRLPLKEVAKDRYTIGRLPAEISFERDADGKVAALVLHQNGKDRRGNRGELPLPATK